jgi:hypothetical protein
MIVAEWAQEIEITVFDGAQPCCGGTTNYNDGGNLSGVVMGDNQVLNISGRDGGGYILSRIEGSEANSKWILFNHYGDVEILKDVWDLPIRQVLRVSNEFINHVGTLNNQSMQSLSLGLVPQLKENRNAIGLAII